VRLYSLPRRPSRADVDNLPHQHFNVKMEIVASSQRTTGGGTLSARVRLRRDTTKGGCMHIEIVPFRDTHLEEAADLLALSVLAT
jgi:hypothetical protein